MVANAQKKWTVEEYLVFERSSEERHEYWDGLVFQVGHPPKTSTKGVGRRHSLIVSNLISSLGNQLINNPCEAYAIGMRVKVTPIKYSYPDVSVVYDTPQFTDDEDNTLLNPTVIIEVLSPSTELADRGKKFDAYRELESVQEYVLIEQHEAGIAHYIRQSGGSWLLSYATTLQSVIHLPSINCTLLLADIYRKVTFEADSNSKES
ncbi:MAG: Uma2 family endonuclease [Chloroflexota bacterium]